MKSLLTVSIFLMSTMSLAQENFEVRSGCQQADYIAADVQASIATQGFSYTPKCLKVVVGSQVTIAASGHHPLAPQASQGNPIVNTTATQTFEFNQPGIYGYFCSSHGNTQGGGMAGSIWVVESL